MIDIRCETCGYSKESDESKQGKIVRCPRCGERIMIGESGKHAKARPKTKQTKTATRPISRPASRPVSRSNQRGMSPEEDDYIDRVRPRQRREDTHAIGIFVVALIGLVVMGWAYNTFYQQQKREEAANIDLEHMANEQAKRDHQERDAQRAVEQERADQEAAAATMAEEQELMSQVNALKEKITDKYIEYAKYQNLANSYHGADVDLYKENLAIAMKHYRVIDTLVESLSELGVNPNDLLESLADTHLKKR